MGRLLDENKEPQTSEDGEKQNQPARSPTKDGNENSTSTQGKSRSHGTNNENDSSATKRTQSSGNSAAMPGAATRSESTLDARIAQKIVQERNRLMAAAAKELEDKPSTAAKPAAAKAPPRPSPIDNHPVASSPGVTSETALDARFAQKIVQERVRMVAEQERQEQTEAAAAAAASHAQEGLNGVDNSNNHEQQRSKNRHPLRASTAPAGAVGAVRVRGMDASADSEDDPEEVVEGGNTATDPINSNNSLQSFDEDKILMSSAPFEPDVPIEATLVTSKRHLHTQSENFDSKIFVEAQPMDQVILEETEKKVAEEHANLEQTKRRYRIAACVLLLAVAALVVGLVVGLMGAADTQKEEGGMAIPEMPLFPPFTSELDPQTVEKIETDPFSPQARANAWVLQDPDFMVYPFERQLLRFALATLFYSTGGNETWINRGKWLDHNTSECDWYFSHPFSVCNETTEQFMFFNLSSNGLRGSLPWEINYISPIKIMDLSNNQLEGGLPALGSGARDVDMIVLSNNNFKGKIGMELGWAGPNLHTIIIDNNQVSGTLPTGYYVILPNLLVLSAARNRFAGTIPYPSSSSLMKYLNFAENLLTGPILPDIINQPSLEYFNVSSNVKMTGSLPTELGALVNLTVLDISHTGITGGIPDELCAREEQQLLDLKVDCSKDQIQCC